MRNEEVICKEIDLTKFLLNKAKIDLGEFALRKNLDDTWDFYLNQDGRSIKRYTYEAFQPIKIVGNAVYVSKRVNKYGVKYAIYSRTGEMKVDFSDTIRECGSILLVEKTLNFGWDFYTKEGERITYENFSFALNVGKFVKVFKKNSIGQFGWGLYNDKGQEIISANWNDILIISSKILDRPIYIILKDNMGNCGVCNLDGSFIVRPEDFYSIECIEEDSIEYVEVKDNSGKGVIYEFVDEGLKKVA